MKCYVSICSFGSRTCSLMYGMWDLSAARLQVWDAKSQLLYEKRKFTGLPVNSESPLCSACANQHEF